MRKRFYSPNRSTKKTMIKLTSYRIKSTKRTKIWRR